MAETTATPVAVVEVVKNCTACSKPMKMAKRYYRNGKYYCNKNCFKGKDKYFLPGSNGIGRS